MGAKVLWPQPHDPQLSHRSPRIIIDGPIVMDVGDVAPSRVRFVFTEGPVTHVMHVMEAP